MSNADTTVVGWGVQWVSTNRREGRRAYLMCGGSEGGKTVPLVFNSRSAARRWVQDRYDYIAHRPDLRTEPHGWRMPRPVRIEMRARLRDGQ